MTGGNWEPARYRVVEGLLPPEGAIIPNTNPGRMLLRFMWAEDMPVERWDDRDRAAYGKAARAHAERGAAEPFTPSGWEERPRYLIVKHTKGGKDCPDLHAMEYRPYRFPPRWKVVPEHHPVCAACGELYPCKHVEAEEVADEQVERGRKRLEWMLSRQPGCCWACGKPITTQTRKLIEFDGENLDLPTGHSPVVFHLAPYDCRAAAAAYETKWVAADPDRRRWRVRCPGDLIMHLDGADCTLGELCPGPDKEHPSFVDHGNGADGCTRCADARARGERR